MSEDGPRFAIHQHFDRPKRERRYPLSLIVQTLEIVGLAPEERNRIVLQLEALMPKRGHPLEQDETDVSKTFNLAGWDESRMTFNRAATFVAEGYPEHQRSAVRKRLARKAKALGKEFGRMGQEAIMQNRQQRKELEALRRRVAELESLSGPKPNKPS